MLSKWVKGFTIFASLIFSVYYIFYIPSEDDLKSRNSSRPSPMSAASPGTEENPNARTNWELMRLRNPKTGKIYEGIRQKELAFAKTLPVKGAGIGKRSGSPALLWKLRGPYNVGGRTRAFALDITDENNMLAGGVSGGMWRSTNGGKNWIKTTSPSDWHNISAIAQDTRTNNTHIWYMGTGEHKGSSASTTSGGIFKSTDKGQSWSPLPNSPKYSSVDQFVKVSRIITNPSKLGKSEIYIAAPTGLYRSIDGGITWDEALSGGLENTSVKDIAITPSGNAFYASAPVNDNRQKIWRSTDGVNWTQITPQGWSTPVSRTVIAIAPSNENIVYFYSASPNKGPHYLWKYTYLSGDGSEDEGMWEDRTASVESQGELYIFNSYSGYCLTIAVKPDDENTVFLGGIGLYKSTDGYTSDNNITNLITSANQHVDQHAIVFSPTNPNIMFSSHDGGISKTLDVSAETVDWESLNNGYVTSQFYTVAIDQTEPGDSTIIGGLQDNGTFFVNSRSTDIPWSQIGGGDGGYAAIADNKSYYYISYQNGYTTREIINEYGERENRGRQTRIDPITDNSVRLFIHPFVLNPSDRKMMFYPVGTSIWRNNDLTEIPEFSYETSVNWEELSNTIGNNRITMLEASTIPANRLYYGSIGGNLFRIDNAHIGDPVPVDITGKDFPKSMSWIASIAADRQNTDHVMVVFSNYEARSIFYSEDGGTSWSHVGGNLEEFPNGSGVGPSVRCAEILNYNGTRYYFVGTSIGLFSTTLLNGSQTVWEREGAESIGNVIVENIDSRDEDGLVVIATHGNGIYSAHAGNMGPLGIDEKYSNIPTDSFLHQNYPNPFNPSTIITYIVHKEGFVTLKVYDTIGQEIQTLVNENQKSNTYSINFDASKLSSGVYFFRLQVGNPSTGSGQGFVETKKMMLMR